MNLHDLVSEPRRAARSRSETRTRRADRRATSRRRASGRIRDLHVVCSDDSIILQGRSRTYHAKQLAHQAVLDLTDGFPLLTNQIVVC